MSSLRPDSAETVFAALRDADAEAAVPEELIAVTAALAELRASLRETAGPPATPALARWFTAPPVVASTPLTWWRRALRGITGVGLGVHLALGAGAAVAGLGIAHHQGLLPGSDTPEHHRAPLPVVPPGPAHDPPAQRTQERRGAASPADPASAGAPAADLTPTHGPHHVADDASDDGRSPGQPSDPDGDGTAAGVHGEDAGTGSTSAGTGGGTRSGDDDGAQDGGDGGDGGATEPDDPPTGPDDGTRDPDSTGTDDGTDTGTGDGTDDGTGTSSDDGIEPGTASAPDDPSHSTAG